MLDIIGERQGDSIGSSSVTESSEGEEEENAEDFQIVRKDPAKVSGQSPAGSVKSGPKQLQLTR